ncbi:MAG: alcohol dehydrogenase catalytic domain-containing protein [Clostridiales bacterium]|nr:alcohol dehydrogenase catalytic domain-containing protein [Clostridiales bacterium]
MAKMKAALMMGPKNIVMGEMDKPTYGDDEVLVNVKHVGVCGADLDFYEHGAIGAWVLSFPHVLGHEPAGVVAEVGKNVTHLKPGDKVVIEPGKPCFVCPTCFKGMYNLCDNMLFMSVPGVPGAFCEYVAWPGRLVYKVPDSMDTADACLTEPLAIGFRSVEQSGIKIGQSAAILGSGCIGLCVALALKAQGITEIYMTDLAPARLEKAKELGVTAVFNAGKEDVVKAILDASGGGVDVVYECSASQAAVDQAVQLIKKGGMYTQIGLFATPKQEVDLNGLIFKEASFTSNFRYRHNHPVAISAIASGTAPISKIVSHRFPVDKLGEAIALNIADKNTVTKIVIEI